MMRRNALALPLVLSLCACVVPKTSYIDTQYHVAHYEDLVVPAQPLPVRVEAHAQENDMATPKDDADIRETVKRILIRSGVFTPSDASSTPATLIVEINDIYSKSQVEKGFTTGLTFGSTKNTVYDDFEIKIFFRDSDGRKRFGSYKHRIVTTNGKLPPPGFAGRPISAESDNSYDYILQDTLLSFLKDYQNAGDQPGSVIFVPTGAGTQGE